MTLIVGITGGMGSGKSTFSKIVVKRGFKLIDSDKQVSLIYKKPKKEFLDYLIKIGLGKSVRDKKIDKQKISKIIFTHRIIKSKLEKYIFKIVKKNRSDFIKKEKRKNTNIIFCDIPLLFENSLEKEFDKIISIISTKKERYKRLLISKNISNSHFKNIIKSQTSDIIRKNKSDIIIYNNGSMQEFIKKTNNTINRIIS